MSEAIFRKKRTSGVLAEKWDLDQVKRLSNGKYMCVVCPSRPVLDTVPMLAVHFEGKKHENYLAQYLEKRKQEKRPVAVKRVDDKVVPAKKRKTGKVFFGPEAHPQNKGEKVVAANKSAPIELPKQKKEAEKEKELRQWRENLMSNGWIYDEKRQKFYKDPNVEWDSDEGDEPPSPPV